MARIRRCRASQTTRGCAHAIARNLAHGSDRYRHATVALKFGLSEGKSAVREPRWRSRSTAPKPACRSGSWRASWSTWPTKVVVTRNSVTSAAVPSKCYSSDDAAQLPPAVFACDSEAEVEVKAQ